MLGIFLMTMQLIIFTGDAINTGAIEVDKFPPVIHAEKFDRAPTTKCTYDYSQPGCQ